MGCWAEALGAEVVAAADHRDGFDGRVEGQGAEAVVEEIAAGVEGYDHQIGSVFVASVAVGVLCGFL